MLGFMKLMQIRYYIHVVAKAIYYGRNRDGTCVSPIYWIGMEYCYYQEACDCLLSFCSLSCGEVTSF
jgi:hypothetical protein